MTGGTSVIAGWFNALVTWGVILAVAAVIVFAGIWALGSIRSTPSTVSRGKWGVLVAIVATMLLGGSKVYLQVLYDKWAPGFRADPASYQVADTLPKIDRYQVVDRSADWDAEITRFRAAAGFMSVVAPDAQLTAVATACATAQAGAPNGLCPSEGYYRVIRYTSATASGLDGLPTEEQLGRFSVLKPPPADHPEFKASNAAFVAVKDNETKHAALVVIVAFAPCDGRCVVSAEGDLGGSIIAHTTGR